MVAWHPVRVVRGLSRVDLDADVISPGVATDVQAVCVQVCHIRVAVGVVGSTRVRRCVANHVVLHGDNVCLASL